MCGILPLGDSMSDIYTQYPGNDIHPTAIIYPNVRMGTGNKIGPTP